MRGIWPSFVILRRLLASINRMHESNYSENHAVPNKPNDSGAPRNLNLVSLVLATVLLAMSVGIYLPTTQHEFLSYDDSDYVSDNSHVKLGLTASSVRWALRTGHAANWHPLTWLSHLIDIEFYGMWAGGHLLTNALLHGLNSALLFYLLLTSTRSSWRSAFVAALFALHPCHVESVAWVAERKDVLSAFFGLSCLVAYCAYAKRRTSEDAQGFANKGFLSSPTYWTALALLALGLMSKPMLVTLPCVMLLMDFWPLNRLRDVPSFARLVVEKLPFFLLVGASCTITILVQRQGGAVQNLGDLSFVSRVENAVVSYARYLGKALWPTNLATPYPHPGDWPNLLTVGSVLLLVVISAVAWVSRRRWPFLLGGWLWFLGMLVPVIGIVQVGAQSMADRYTYLPFIGIFFALVWTSHAVLMRSAEQLPEFGRPSANLTRPDATQTSCTFWQNPLIPAVLAAGILCTLGLMTWRQIPVWRNSETLFRHAISVTENNWIAYYNLGWHLDRQGKLDEALGYYRKAAEIEPNFPNSWNNTGCALAALKRYEDAIPYFEKALALRPYSIEVALNLANALREAGRNEGAMQLYQNVLENMPENRTALNALGALLLSKGDLQRAIPYLQKSLALDASQPSTHYTLANALTKSRRLPEALDHYQQASSGLPEEASVRNDYALCLARLGRMNEAVQILREALSKHPRNATIRVTLGRMLANQQRFDQAISLFDEALAIAPDNADAHASLGPLLAMRGETELAIGHLKKAITQRPEDHVAHFNLGRALASEGKTSEAADHFKQVLKLKPDYMPAQNELENLERVPQP